MTRKLKKYSQGQVDTIIELHLKGLSSRAICRELGISEKRKSNINYLLKDWREGKVKYSKSETKTTEKGWEVSEEKLESLCEHPDWNVSNLAKRLRTAQRTNNQLRKVQREVFDNESSLCVEDVISKLSDSITKTHLRFDVNVFPKEVSTQRTNKTVEVLFSDLQIGKKSEFYNTDVAKKALKYYGERVVDVVCRVKPEHIVFASLGDIVEDHLKHGVQSAISTDTGLAEQIADAIRYGWEFVLKPLIDTGTPITFIGVQGNHGSSEHKGMDMYKAGRFGYDYTIHKTWETMCKIAETSHVEFILPEGCFATYDIYGQKYLYEHGYFNGVSEKQMEDHKKKRQENIKQYIHGYRQGDKHHGVQYDNSNLICNGSFFGIERQGVEYSGILGFNSIPLQAVIVHEPVSGEGQSTISEVIQIQIAKGY